MSRPGVLTALITAIAIAVLAGDVLVVTEHWSDGNGLGAGFLLGIGVTIIGAMADRVFAVGRRSPRAARATGVASIALLIIGARAFGRKGEVGAILGVLAIAAAGFACAGLSWTIGHRRAAEQ